MAGDLQQRQTSNAEIAGKLVDTVAPLVLQTGMLIFYLIVMLRYSPFLSLIGLISVFGQVFVSRIISNKRINITRVMMRDSGKLAGATVSGIEMIENFSMKMAPGSTVAFVGASGCGKSTLMRMLLGFERPQRGAIYYDGKDLERMDLKSLRQKIGTVIQDGKLFTGDIYSNIVITNPRLTLDDAWEAAEVYTYRDRAQAFHDQAVRQNRST